MRVAQTNSSGKIIQGILLSILMVLLALTVLIQANPGKKTPGRDYGFYVYIGDEILRGKLPYRDAWESKPPAIFYLNAAALWLGHGSRWGVWAVEILSLLIAEAVSFNLMKKLWGTWPALFGLLLWLYGLSRSLLGGNLTEEYPLPLHFIALALFLKLIPNPQKRLPNFLLGLSFALVFLFRPNNAAIEAAIILIILIAQAVQRNFRNILTHLLWIGSGAALPLAFTALYFWSRGLLSDLLNASILYNLAYSGTQITSSSPFLYGFRMFGVGMWIALAGYFIAAFQIKNAASHGYLYLLLLIGSPMVIYLSDPAKRNYDHYYMNWLPFLALLGSLVFYFLQSKLLPRSRDSANLNLAGIAIALVLSLFYFFSNSVASDYQRVMARVGNREKIGLDTRSPIATYVNEHTKPGDLVLFWGAYPGENFMSDRESPSAVLFYPLFVKSDISTQLDDQFLRELKKNRPVMIVDMGDYEALSLDPIERRKRLDAGVGWQYLPDNIDEVFAFIDQNYSRIANVKGMGVYRLKGTQ
ncbi:MAG: glycosyltransferase family 39 protein [Chloroflexi bacterium]|nr:glycosyltransferase family 39 protein [Chloroflexota bacterium]MBI3340069.1 glycosyltransferase family 39 protein [Chloroflexota bacterium]